MLVAGPGPDQVLDLGAGPRQVAAPLGGRGGAAGQQPAQSNLDLGIEGSGLAGRERDARGQGPEGRLVEAAASMAEDAGFVVGPVLGERTW